MESFVYKYQPKRFDEYEITSDMIHMLHSLVSVNILSVLLIGPFGSGKTTLLQTIINEYYQLESNSCHYSDHILHINSLKEQGINYYRTEVKTFCQTKSLIKDRKKMIIMDDIDLINEQSQQVFRNYMDKYRSNVHFIASSSNIQKVIESLQSRFILLNVSPVQRQHMTNIVDKIVQSESLDIDETAIRFMIDICEGNVKKLINYLEKCKLLNCKITYDNALHVCTNISFLTFTEYTRQIQLKDIQSAIVTIYGIYHQGYSVIDILDTYFAFVKHTNMICEKDKYKIISHICKYIGIFHTIHEDEIELALFTNNLIISL